MSTGLDCNNITSKALGKEAIVDTNIGCETSAAIEKEYDYALTKVLLGSASDPFLTVLREEPRGVRSVDASPVISVGGFFERT